ncbi:MULTISPECIES: DUF1028 domain-containing protein [unclassified Mycobacterium]|uniref:DUF1028 domain-containing protein n=1 Tax=unclassified Mycobacterium TaxID=2642494 RepID=UPI00073FE82A|nr:MULTISPECIES: DUF1028 domain-containing protein [unclassified Mycobacterium]KUH81294.1 hypothetical protein AU187_00830 [Mycobacterium sp. IS-1556]KUH89291.1 hypothetical protein AU186_12915 [Mycobacterium sp. GA-1999]KUH89540.1 hypothetical protein AU185_14835 [Mycobacterium sp. GA-0227b]KUH93816.1 hypothetical protein AU188_07220 [Mycobacterium sp. IS-3022]
MTYSIVARDARTGLMGVACQSQAFAVGSSVPWAMSGSGAIATQSMGEPMYGELGLDILRSGLTAGEALTALRSVDANPERRQVAMIDTCGNIAVYTGEACVPAAGHLEGNGCVALANMVVSEAVWEAMVDAWEHTEASVPARLARALHAAEDEGGDIRGKRSAAMVVVDPTTTGRPWHDRLVDLRVDDHEDPLGMLDQLLALNTRYHNAVEAFDLALGGNTQDALARLDGAPAPDPLRDPDIALWTALVLALAGREDDAARVLAGLSSAAPQFLEAARRFDEVRLLPPNTPVIRLLDELQR